VGFRPPNPGKATFLGPPRFGEQSEEDRLVKELLSTYLGTRNWQLATTKARYANWHSGQVESLMSVGSTPTRATQ
jgi:hypothetical protein